MATYTPQQSCYFAHRLSLRGDSEEAALRSLAAARVDVRPHQVDAAIHALRSPISKGMLLADEVGLGKTIEAGLVIAQLWAEQRRRILLVLPSGVVAQWRSELEEKFALPTVLVDHRARRKARAGNAFDVNGAVVITTPHAAAPAAADLEAITWDLVVVDEAHWMRNVHSAGPKAIARKLGDAVAGRFTVLLSATPLHNSAKDVVGVLSVLDPGAFGDVRDIATGAAHSEVVDEALKRALAPRMHRTLRKTVEAAGHVRYTRRLVRTVDFGWTDEEQALYDAVTDYIETQEAAFGGRITSLMLMHVRRLLGSSTAALAAFLEKLAGRLRNQATVGDDAIAALLDEDADGRRRRGRRNGADTAVPPDPETIARELATVERCLAAARALNADTKTRRLIEVLPQLLDEAERKGGRRKVVIFTQSIPTLRHLRDALNAGPFARRVLTLSGQATDPESHRILERWRRRHRGSDQVTGHRTSDAKAAVIDAFRSDDKEILIASGVGEEGINLQFCSVVVNFDIPWNPQRLAQRIGRCHRYGQELDVVVVNLVNQANAAEARAYELLGSKFRLFEEAFGASDEVLGELFDGGRVEYKLSELLRGCRSQEEIRAAFGQLEAKLERKIARDLETTAVQVLEHFDHDVARPLLERQSEIDAFLSQHERALLAIARAELPGARFRRDRPRRFTFDGAAWSTDWRAAETEPRCRFFRLAENTLAGELVDRARTRVTDDPVGLRFGYNDYRRLADPPHPHLSDVRRLIGRSGWLKVSLLTADSAAGARDALIVTAITDGGKSLAPETIDRLFLLPARSFGIPERNWPKAKMDGLEDAAIARQIAAWNGDDADTLRTEHAVLEATRAARLAARRQQIRSLIPEAGGGNGQPVCSVSSPGINPENLRQAMESIKATFDEGTDLLHRARSRMDDDADRLRFTTTRKPILKVRWEVRP